MATTVTPPAIHPTPAAPDWWEIQGVEVAHDIAGPAQYGDPAGLTELERTIVAQNAADAVAHWHDLAASVPFATRPWKQLLSPDSWSGHKLHIAAATLADVQAALSAVFTIAWTAGMGMKAATNGSVLPTGKGVVLYLPRRDTVDRDTSLIAAALTDYQPSGPVVCVGSTHLTGGLWWRHEFGGIDPGYDVFDPREYRSLYVPAVPKR